MKEQELNLGLDLKGGMSVTLEVSLPDLLIALSDYSDNEDFRGSIAAAKALRNSTGDDFITLFERAWTERAPEVELWRIFHNMENKDLFPAKSTDDEVFAILRTEAQTAIDNTESIIRKRIDQLGVAQPNVQKLQNGRILVELPGIDDRERARKQLKSTANLEFWETYFNDEVIGRLGAANEALGRAMSPELYGEDAPADSAMSQDQMRAKNPLFAAFQMELGRRSPVVGYALTSDTNRVNDLLASRKRHARRWATTSASFGKPSPATNVAQLFAIKDPSGKGKAEAERQEHRGRTRVLRRDWRRCRQHDDEQRRLHCMGRHDRTLRQAKTTAPSPWSSTTSCSAPPTCRRPSPTAAPKSASAQASRQSKSSLRQKTSLVSEGRFAPRPRPHCGRGQRGTTAR